MKCNHLLALPFFEQNIGNKILSEREIKWRYKSQMSRHEKTKREGKDTLEIKCTQKERVSLDVKGHFSSPFLFGVLTSRLWSGTFRWKDVKGGIGLLDILHSSKRQQIQQGEVTGNQNSVSESRV